MQEMLEKQQELQKQKDMQGEVLKQFQTILHGMMINGAVPNQQAAA